MWTAPACGHISTLPGQKGGGRSGAGPFPGRIRYQGPSESRGAGQAGGLRADPGSAARGQRVRGVDDPRGGETLRAWPSPHQAAAGLNGAVDQALILRGSRDFHTADDYAGFVREMVEKRNRLVRGKLEQEMACLRPLPPAPMPEYANYQSKVRRWSTVQVAGRSYSVPSRLIGKVVQIRLYSDHLEVYYKGHFVERMARVRGDGEVNVNYRHVINSLVRKPGAFARYRFREQLFPTMRFRLTYDALKQWRGERADVEYVRILHLSATTMEANMDSALSLLLEAGQPFDYPEVRELAEPKPPEAPALVLSGKPDLKVYDGLLTVSLAGLGVCG